MQPHLDITSAAEVRKAVEAIAIEPRSGKITLLTRRLFNALLYHAQKQGANMPTYKAPLAAIIQDLGFDSNNTEVLKDHLRRMLEIRVEWYDPGRSWEASTLVSHVKIEKVDDGRIWLEWSYSPTVKAQLVRPEIYTMLSMHFQTLLRSTASLALYEICKRYATSPGKLTMRAPWQWWVPVLTGVPGPVTMEYKYFKRDVLKPIVIEVNTLTDVTVELIEHGVGRRISALQFKIVPNRQGALDLHERQVFDSRILDRMMALGMSHPEAQQICAGTDETFVVAALEATEARQNGPGEVLRSPAAYFKDALRRGWARPAGATTATPLVKNHDSQALLAGLKSAYEENEREEARRMFREAGDSQQDHAIAAFETDCLPNLPLPVARAYKRQGLEAKMVEANFIGWLAKRTWPDRPSDQELLNFGLARGLIKTVSDR